MVGNEWEVFALMSTFIEVPCSVHVGGKECVCFFMYPKIVSLFIKTLFL